MRSLSGRFGVPIIIFVVCMAVQAQKVEVSEEFLKSADKAFSEIILLREQNKLLNEIIKNQETIIAEQKNSVQQLKTEIELKDKKIDILNKLKCDKTILFFGLVKRVKCRE